VQPTSPTPSATATTTSSGKNANGCTPPPSPQASPQRYRSEPKLTISKTRYTATIVTNCGTVVVALDGRHAPHTVNSFAFLAGKGYFNDTPCHRLTTSGIYVLQCGDPTGTGTGGPGYTIPDENLKGATYPAGTIAMANTGQPHTGGSQFFLVYKNTSLPPQYTPFGKVTAGLDVLLRIAAAGSNPPGDGSPVQPVMIESFTVTKG
jgi:peptidyl-prolyl cis-trans isomerase B (cyclophilin B)